MIVVDSVSVYLDYILSDSMRAVVISCFDRSQQIIRSFAAQLNLRQGRGTIKVLKENGASKAKAIESHYEVYIEPVEVGKEKAYHALLVSSEIGATSFFTSNGNEGRDFYRYLMKSYTWPLLEKWGEALYRDAINWKDCCINDRRVEVEYGRFLRDSQNREVFGIPIDQLKIIRAGTYSESNLMKSIQNLFQNNEICISTNPQMDFRNVKMDDYFKTYGHTIVANLEKTVQPLIPIKGSVDNILLDNVRLYPQQAAVVNGIVELLQNSKYAFLAEGMGTGKTLQSMSVCESYAVREYMKKNPSKTLKEIYSDPECIRYRNIVMCPGHLVYKWADEIKKRIPFSEVTVLTSFSQLIELRKKGPERKYREYYIMSMDFAKLTYSQRPVPTKVRHGGRLKQKRCIDCGTEYMNGLECPRCKSKHFRWIEDFDQLSVQRGLVCPNCDQYLLKREDGYYRPMMPPDFANQNVSNSNCYYCGTSLWEPNVKNLTLMFGDSKKRRQWYKITHYANAAKNSVKTAWVLDGYEQEYLASIKKSVLKTYRDADGVRKYSPATFIKKYMRGFFDFAIFDEVHKFKGGTTGQGNAMDSLVKASRHQLALTGTIAGGKADHLFYLLYRLDPVRMVKAGFSWSSVMRFAEQYGSIEVEYALEDGHKMDGTISSIVRGRQIGAPRTKPGISPRLFTDFLLDRACFLDLSDMGKYLPPFVEKVVTVPIGNTASNMFSHYQGVLKRLLDESKEAGQFGLLGARLQFSLSYLDKPFGKSEIKSPLDGRTICRVADYSELYDGLLPKEEELLNILRDEMDAHRKCVIFAEYTSSEATCVTGRLKEIIEHELQLKVSILEASSPAPAEREAWMHDQAENHGIEVFITNPRCVETGLDFLWEKDGVLYNYPTLILYQLGTSLFTVWQASRRAYRLTQREECRVYYMGYENTIQTAVISLIAEKQVATSATQGKFSTEGIAAMANGVDERVKLAAALAKQDFESKEKLQNMFDQIASHENIDDSVYEGFEPMKTVEEEIGEELYRSLRKEFFNEVDVEDVFTELFESMDDEFEDIMVDQNTSVQVKKQTESIKVAEQKPPVKKGSILSSGAALAGLFF